MSFGLFFHFLLLSFTTRSFRSDVPGAGKTEAAKIVLKYLTVASGGEGDGTLFMSVKAMMVLS
jgi:hypothetical protein